jgi:hypothetical protein
VIQLNPAIGAIDAECAEAMFVQGKFSPLLDARMQRDWQVLFDISGTDALLGYNDVLADVTWYGFCAQSLTDEKTLIVVTRGTERWKEWLIDAKGFLVKSPYGGCVEQGFYSVQKTLTAPDRATGVAKPWLVVLAQWIRPGTKIIFMGHSLGATIAIYNMLDAHKALGDKATCSGLFYACPKPGDMQFADSIPSDLTYTVFDYKLDIVPTLPPTLPFGLGFQHLHARIVLEPGQNGASFPFSIEDNHNALNYAKLLGAPQ